MDYIRSISELSKHDVAQAGGKGASLGELTLAGALVPTGFVILTTGFDEFIRQAGIELRLREKLLSSHDAGQLENISQEIRELFLKYELPANLIKAIQAACLELDTQHYAVRSSATVEDSARCAWAGQLDSFLGVTDADVLQSVRDCWLSLYTPRALSYRAENGLTETPISVAVVIQTMIPAEHAGVAFTVHPVTEDANHIVIEAAKGLGEALVGGYITPDSYTFAKDTKTIVDQYIGVQTRALLPEPKGTKWQDLSYEEGSAGFLTPDEVMVLGESAFRIEKHYDQPQDIEWVKVGSDFYIVQSRPITTL